MQVAVERYVDTYQDERFRRSAASLAEVAAEPYRSPEGRLSPLELLLTVRQGA